MNATQKMTATVKLIIDPLGCSDRDVEEIIIHGLIGTEVKYEGLTIMIDDVLVVQRPKAPEERTGGIADGVL